jgi:hypothetical protein
VSRTFAVIYEAQADFTTATEIADRVMLTEIDWLDAAILPFQRGWLAELPVGRWLTWSSIPSRAREQGIRVRGHFDGEPGLPDAQAARRAIAYILHVADTIDAIVLVRDMDDQTERANGLKQARQVYSSRCRIVIGAANREREAWVISGFHPGDDAEKNALALETQKLGHDPCLHSHELTAGKNDQALRSPKRVLKALTGGDWSREQKCWHETPLQVLKERGAGNGLANYLDEVKVHLVPLISGRANEGPNER